MKARVSHGGAEELSPNAEILCCMLVCTTDECTHHTCKETTGQHDDEVMTDDEPLTPMYILTCHGVSQLEVKTCVMIKLGLSRLASVRLCYVSC